MTIDPTPTLAIAQPVSLARTVLHVGCGIADPSKIPAAFFPLGEWQELRLDIDPGVAPDIVASITDMSVVPSGSVQAVWSAHNLEHLFPHEVPVALAEFNRVLAPGGFVLVTMPDLQQVAELVVQGRLEDAAYMSAMGPISPIDMLYGHRASIAQGNHFMGHKGGFVASSLAMHLEQAGFQSVRVQRDGHFALWGSGVKAQ
jgi:SAM-dependent methyltransferase